MKKYEVVHYEINLNTINVNRLMKTTVYADTMHVSESNALMFFETLESDGSMRAIKAWNDGVWIYAAQIEDEQHEVVPEEINRAELYAIGGLM